METRSKLPLASLASCDFTDPASSSFVNVFTSLPSSLVIAQDYSVYFGRLRWQAK
jgi:hypothetical protein